MYGKLSFSTLLTRNERTTNDMGKRLDAINNTRHFLYPIRNEHSLDCLEMVR